MNYDINFWQYPKAECKNMQILIRKLTTIILSFCFLEHVKYLLIRLLIFISTLHDLSQFACFIEPWYLCRVWVTYQLGLLWYSMSKYWCQWPSKLSLEINHFSEGGVQLYYDITFTTRDSSLLTLKYKLTTPSTFKYHIEQMFKNYSLCRKSPIISDIVLFPTPI